MVRETEYRVIVPEENRVLVIVEESQTIEVPAEWRWVEVPDALGVEVSHRRRYTAMDCIV